MSKLVRDQDLDDTPNSELARRIAHLNIAELHARAWDRVDTALSNFVRVVDGKGTARDPARIELTSSVAALWPEVQP